MPRCRVWPVWAFLPALVACSAEPTVHIVSPAPFSVVHSERVEVGVSVEGISIPGDGYVEIYLNSKLLHTFHQLKPGLIIMLEDGWHQIEAVLYDQSGIPITDAFESFEVDVHAEEESRSPEHAAGALPMVKGLVTAVIGSKNRYDSLIRTIWSIRNQTYPHVEIILIDDGSSDPRYFEPISNVTVVRLAHNVGKPGLVRNRGIALASGEWVAFVDDDDVWFPRKLEAQVAAMRRLGVNMSSTDALVGHGPYGIGRYIKREWSGHLTEANPGVVTPPEDIDPLKEWPPWGYPRWLGDLASEATVRSCTGEDVLPERWNRSLLVRNNFHICSSVIVNRDALIRAGGFGDKVFAEDYELWKRVMRHTDSAFVSEPLTYYQLHPDGFAAAYVKEQQGMVGMEEAAEAYRAAEAQRQQVDAVD